MQEKKQTDSSSQVQTREQKLDTLLDKIDTYSDQMDKNQQDIAQIKEELATITTSIEAENDSSGNQLDKKYKKILKVIDIIALAIILFIIVDGVFNNFNWLYALSQFITNLL